LRAIQGEGLMMGQDAQKDKKYGLFTQKIQGLPYYLSLTLQVI
jgi:hypothetical protein